jgi:hypothetical protein
MDITKHNVGIITYHNQKFLRVNKSNWYIIDDYDNLTKLSEEVDWLELRYQENTVSIPPTVEWV